MSTNHPENEIEEQINAMREPSGFPSLRRRRGATRRCARSRRGIRLAILRQAGYALARRSGRRRLLATF